MDTNNEIDDLLKRSMQFGEDEIPEPDLRIHENLRKKINGTKIRSSTFINTLVQFMNLDIKLYHAGIAVAIVTIIFFMLRNTKGDTQHIKNDIIIADTNTGSNPKDD